ncbi:MAG: glycine--tRNA ligase [Christensenellaceae bacterium]|jgi:glycyl-tRNA synthetase|nr:glycine--tRNA ligase [Christensenellaceae bacterium]
MEKIDMEKMVSLCKQYGFIFQGSEIYDGLANTWDYGPLGIELKNNVKRAWWKKFVTESKNSYGVDAAILMNPRIWEASGHVSSFSDPLIDCKDCKTRHRADNLIKEFDASANPDALSNEQMMKYIKDNKIKCPRCKGTNFTDIREFNLMFETSRGVTEDSKNIIYLRPETAQGEFVNFLNVQRSMRAKLPFGIGQIGKAFRNEITPGNFTFRTIEFEQMEHQLFCKNGTDEKFYDYYKKYAFDFLISLGMNKSNLKFHDHDKLSHYAKSACDIYYNFPMGFSELWGTHNRTDYDLTRHQEFSKKSMEYFDSDTNEKYIPYIVESSVGCDRMVLAFLLEAYREEKLDDGTTREVMNFHPFLAPYKVAVLPLVKKYHSEKADEIFSKLAKSFPVSFDDTGSIGKRYRRQDVSGTPFCITVDDETLKNGTVTIRDRDTMKQEVIKIDEIKKYIEDKMEF